MPNLPENDGADQTPNNQTPFRLTIKPYAAEVFTDFARGKEFVTLHYRHKKHGPRAEQLALIGDVIDDLAQAGLSITGAMTIKLSPDQGRALEGTQPPHYRCHLEVPVRPLAERQEEHSDWIRTMRETFGK